MDAFSIRSRSANNDRKIRHHVLEHRQSSYSGPPQLVRTEMHNALFIDCLGDIDERARLTKTSLHSDDRNSCLHAIESILDSRSTLISSCSRSGDLAAPSMIEDPVSSCFECSSPHCAYATPTSRTLLDSMIKMVGDSHGCNGHFTFYHSFIPFYSHAIENVIGKLCRKDLGRGFSAVPNTTTNLTVSNINLNT